MTDSSSGKSAPRRGEVGARNPLRQLDRGFAKCWAQHRPPVLIDHRGVRVGRNGRPGREVEGLPLQRTPHSSLSAGDGSSPCCVIGSAPHIQGGSTGSNPVTGSWAGVEEESIRIRVDVPHGTHDPCKRNLGRGVTPGSARTEAAERGRRTSQARVRGGRSESCISLPRGFESRHAHGKEGEERVSDFIAIEDGHVFLSREELDEYRTQTAEREHEESHG